MISQESIDIAYSFFHQKERIYRFSTLAWQRDDIEYAIDDYVSQMNPELYALIADGRTDYLRDHTRFAEDMADAVEKLEQRLVRRPK